MLGVARVRLLLANRAGPNLGRMAHPQFVLALGQQPLEPQRRNRRLDPHHCSPRQAGVKLPRLSLLMLQPASLDLPGLFIHPRYNLVARMQITSDNRHGLGSFPGKPWSDKSKFTGVLEPTPLSNQTSESVVRGIHSGFEAK